MIKSFETGSAEIDALHRELVEECNRLLLAVEDGVAWSRIVADTSRLVEGCVQISRMKTVDGSLEEHHAYPREFGPMLVELIIRHDLDYRSHLLHQQGR